MRVSVALCTYNGSAYLTDQLASLLQQELLPFEVVLCDDCSTDGTLAIAEAFASRSPFPVHIFRNDRPLGSTRNFEQAMRSCQGDVIALCDQDDIWYPQKLRVLAAVIEAASAGGAFSDGDLLRDNTPIAGTLWKSFGLIGIELETFRSGDAIAVLLRGNKVTGMTLMFRREILSHALPIPEFWTHDYWLAWILVLYSRLIACPEHLVAYRTHAHQQLGIPTRFFVSVRQNGLRRAFHELGERAAEESRRLQLQFEHLLQHLRRDVDTGANAGTVARLEQRVDFLHMRSQIWHHSRARRTVSVLSHWTDYRQFSLKPSKDMLVDIIAATANN